MPVSRIEARKGFDGEKKRALTEAVHGALVEAFKIPEHDRFIRFVEYEPEDFVTPQGSEETYVLVEITAFSGRSMDAKRALYQTIVKRFEAIGVAKQDVRIILYEVPKENWGIRGGVPASEVNLGYRVDV
jgi:phenylpyruvate tautomerase PptA (4-oxalocrotonate tautomerase family)